MKTQITTSTSATATAYSNQRKVDRCQNGVMLALFQNGVNTSPQETLYYSTDNGATWIFTSGPMNDIGSSSSSSSIYRAGFSDWSREG